MRHGSTWLLLASALLLAACDGTESPLAPADESDPLGDTASGELATALTTWPRIAYSSRRDGNTDIYVMNPQGYQVTRLTTVAKPEVSPAWSYNNKRIALVRPRKDASNVLHDDIYVINADGTGGRWVLASPSPYDLSHPSWSPDGSHILVTIAAQGVWYLGSAHLYTRILRFTASGGNAVPGKQPSYDPTGQRIVYVGWNSKTLDVMNADGTGHVVLLSTPTSALDRPAFSPDGKRIAFSNQASNGDQELFVRNGDGSITRLTYATGTDLWPTWSPDGSRIAFGSTRNGKLQLWSMSSGGGSATRISRNSYDERTPAYSH